MKVLIIGGRSEMAQEMVKLYKSKGYECIVTCSNEKSISDIEALYKEISNIIETQYQRAIKLLKKHKSKLIELANFLLEKEVIFKEDLIRIYGERPFDPKDLVKKK